MVAVIRMTRMTLRTDLNHHGPCDNEGLSRVGYGGGGNRTRVRSRTGKSVYKRSLRFAFARRPARRRPTAGLALLWGPASGEWLSLGSEPVDDAGFPIHGPRSGRRVA